MKFDHRADVIFLDPNNTDGYNHLDGKKLNIILSPSLYWVKKVSLPVKSQREAKKLLPSLFEDTLPEGNYSYSVYKEGDEFYIFAYEDKKIMELISKSSISFSDVLGVYFAQSVLDDVDGAMKVNDTQSIYVKDGIVLLVPCCWIEESGRLDFSTIKFPKHKVPLQQYGHIIDSSYLHKLIVVLIALNVLIFINYEVIKTKTDHILELKEKLFVKYDLKPTSFQNISMLKRYTKIDQKQKKIRNSIPYVLSLKFNSNEKLSKIALKKTKLVFEFSNASIMTDSFVKKQLNLKNINFNTKLENRTLYLEIPL